MKLFGERRNTSTVGSTLKGIANENVSLRIQPTLRSGQKSNIGAGNYSLANQKSQKSIGATTKQAPTLMSGGGLRGVSTRGDYKSNNLASQTITQQNQLKISSARQDNISSSIGGSHSTKNAMPAFKSKLQSRYG